MKFRLHLLILPLFVGQVSAIARADSPNLSPNAGFEVSNVNSGGFLYSGDVEAPNWVFVDGSGIANHSGAWGGEALYSAVAFLQYQGAADASLTQIITSSASSFEISFDVAQRGSYGIGAIDVYWDNKIILQGFVPATASFERLVLPVDGLPGIIHTLTFRAAPNAQNQEGTAVFVDNVSIEESVAP